MVLLTVSLTRKETPSCQEQREEHPRPGLWRGEERLSQPQGIHAKEVTIKAPNARHSPTVPIMACCGITPQETGEKVIWITHKDRFFKFFDSFLSNHTIDQKDPYLGTGNFTVTIPMPNSLSVNLEGGLKF